MKTTVDISDPVLRDARALAEHEATTIDALVEQGLRRVLADRALPATFRLRKASFRGRGLTPGAAAAGWDEIRAIAQGGRGG